MAEKEKPNILILGGVGFIGRNVVQWLVHHRAAKHIRVVDKVLPSVAFLGKDHKEAFADSSVKFKQGNAQSTGPSDRRGTTSLTRRSSSFPRQGLQAQEWRDVSVCD